MATQHDLVQCPDCGNWHNVAQEHTCVEYDPSHACPECGAPSVFVTIAAPGTGRGWECRNGHFDGFVRELTLEDVI